MKLSSALFAASGLAVLIAAMPFFATFGAAAVASATGCTLNEGSAHTCMIFSFDLGPTLYAMGVAFWLFILTWLYIPVAFGLVIAGTVVLVRGQTDPSRNQPIGMAFWLLTVAAMAFPFFRDIALGLAVIAGYFAWRKKRVTTANP